MYPIAHAWLIAQLVPAATDAHLLGCVWPDMLYASPLDHARSHKSGRLLAQRARTLPDLLDGETFRAFVLGVLTHGSEPRGFDWYSDEAYGDENAATRGYAFQQGKPLAEASARACDVALDQGWWKAHNIVEMAFEPALWRDRPKLGEGIARACADERLVECVTRELSAVFGEPQAGLATAIQRFPEVITLRPDSAKTLAEVYALQVRLKHPGAAPDVSAIAHLIGQAEELIAASKDDFLATCVARVGAMAREVLSR